MDNKLVSIKFPYPGHALSGISSEIFVNILKMVLYNRMQIPETVQGLEHLLTTQCTLVNSSERPSKQKVRSSLMQRRKNEKYQKCSMEIISKLENLNTSIANLVDSFQVNEFMILIGATPITAKEIFLIKLPKCNKSVKQRDKQLAMYCTRKILSALLQHEMPLKVTTTLTHIFAKSNQINDENWLPWPTFVPPVKKIICNLDVGCEQEEIFTELDHSIDYKNNTSTDATYSVEENPEKLENITKTKKRLSIEDAFQLIMQEDSAIMGNEDIDDYQHVDYIVDMQHNKHSTEKQKCLQNTVFDEPVWYKSNIVFRGFVL